MNYKCNFTAPKPRRLRAPTISGPKQLVCNIHSHPKTILITISVAGETAPWFLEQACARVGQKGGNFQTIKLKGGVCTTG